MYERGTISVSTQIRIEVRTRLIVIVNIFQFTVEF